MALANIVKSSLGPVGLDKMLVRATIFLNVNRLAPRPASFVWALHMDVALTMCCLLRAVSSRRWHLDSPLTRPSSRLPCLQVDSIGDVTITNDGATILKQLEVEHPAAKVLVDLAELQDSEVGDGTTSVVILAAELLKRANDLVRAKIHPTSIMSGYRLAMKEAVKYIKTHLTVSTDKMVGGLPVIEVNAA